MLSRAQTTKGFIVELMPVILYIEDASYFVCCQFARVDEKILSICFVTNVFDY